MSDKKQGAWEKDAQHGVMFVYAVRSLMLAASHDQAQDARPMMGGGRPVSCAIIHAPKRKDAVRGRCPFGSSGRANIGPVPRAIVPDKGVSKRATSASAIHTTRRFRAAFPLRVLLLNPKAVAVSARECAASPALMFTRML